MALRSDGEKKIKITINVYENDWEWFKEQYTKTGASKAARTVLRNHKIDVQKKIAAMKKATDVEIQL